MLQVDSWILFRRGISRGILQCESYNICCYSIHDLPKKKMLKNESEIQFSPWTDAATEQNLKLVHKWSQLFTKAMKNEPNLLKYCHEYICFHWSSEAKLKRRWSKLYCITQDHFTSRKSGINWRKHFASWNWCVENIFLIRH